MDDKNDATLMAAVAADLQSRTDEQVTVRAIVERTLDVVPESEHVSLTVRARHGRFRTMHSTSEVADVVDRLQYSLDEGPCVQAATEAVSEDAWVRSGDIVRDRRWPRWGAEAARHGVRSLLSIQLSHRDEPLGALNIYSTRAGRFVDRETVDLGLLYAVHAANALSSARLITGLETALSSRHMIGMAQGIVMERYSLDAQASFELLRRHATSTNRKLRDVAQELVDTRALPDGT